MNASRSSSISRPVRVTVISRIYTPEPSAGSMRLQALVTELADRQCDVRVLTTKPPHWIPVPESRSNETVVRWPVLRDRGGYVRGYLQYLSYDVPVFFRILFGRRADVYVIEPPPTTGTVARWAAWMRRRPYVYYAADIWSDAAHMTGAKTWVVNVVRLLEKYALNGARLNLVVSDGVVERIEELTPDAKMISVGHGVDTELFSPEGPRAEGVADIVYVGTMSEWHGASIAVEALAIVMRERPDLTAAFIGQGADKDRLADAAIRLGIADRVSFHAPVPAADAATWLRSARIALATLKPGQGYDFAVPTKLYAALSVGTPVAYAGPAPLAKLIREEQLGAASAYDIDEYAAAIRRLLETSDGSRQLRLTEWVKDRVSAAAVAARAAEGVLSVAGSDGGTSSRGEGR
ncbi:glycosyltransferase family 4 protein [Microbacterium sp. GXF0217]